MSTRQTVSSASPYEQLFGFCRALRMGNVVHVAGQLLASRRSSPMPRKPVRRRHQAMARMLR